MAGQKTRQRAVPDYALEQRLQSQGLRAIAGVDEVGRGPLAGPVTAAAVILNPAAIPAGMADSKVLTERQREHLFELICASSWVSVASVPAPIIDRINIRQATFRAMQNALDGLAVKSDFALVDGRDIPPGLKIPAEAVIGGDGKCLSIAAASIVAKTVRDRVMARCHALYPDYHFNENKGYPTARHRQTLMEKGPTPLHRHSFRPVAEAVSMIEKTPDE